ncbi:DUF4393 domain-containing protein [Denitromonas ohlonensis]|uniref:DUF4393 domain-containing protein n=2 Tax=Denitromonas TaxID=139331 RepID=A0A557RBZ7_9RHOO|nr:DUF4393 domain-containing protein [Denitromonas ohlonensis]TVO62618.1 DUF4393 domain-containing protein [Denitromonas ohlonensis]TVO78822.1 DUF4393 domain-containing protein [Denitromonas ohlonensis]
MTANDPLEVAKGSVSLVAEVVKVAGDSPQVREAANNLGQTAVTLTQTINNVLVPLAAINFAFDKARAYFSDKFRQDIAAKAEAIPAECIVEPKASIAGPTLQGLAFTHEEKNLKEMYLNLLATAMDGRSASVAHPAFVEIIKQMDSEDARLVRDTLQTSDSIPIVQIVKTLDNAGGHSILARHFLNLLDTNTGEAVEDLGVPAMIDNWIRLGLVEVTYDKYLADPDSYSWVEKRPEFQRLVHESQAEGVRVEKKRGLLCRTDLGERFARAVGLLSPYSD